MYVSTGVENEGRAKTKSDHCACCLQPTLHVGLTEVETVGD